MVHHLAFCKLCCSMTTMSISEMDKLFVRFYVFAVFMMLPVVCSGWTSELENHCSCVWFEFVTKYMFVCFALAAARLSHNWDCISVKSIHTSNQRICNFHITVVFFFFRSKHIFKMNSLQQLSWLVFFLSLSRNILNAHIFWVGMVFFSLIFLWLVENLRLVWIRRMRIFAEAQIIQWIGDISFGKHAIVHPITGLAH